jgi:hypothetical protein
MSGPYSGPGFIRIRGVTVLKVEKIDFSLDTGNTDVDLMLEGRDGHNRGPLKVMADVDGAIPQSGLHIDWYALAAEGQEVPLDFVLAGKERQCVGDVRNVKLNSAVGRNSWSFQFHGRPLNT